MTFTAACHRSGNLGTLIPEEHVATHDTFAAGTIGIFIASCIGAAANKK
jgi:hypothetical protein